VDVDRGVLLLQEHLHDLGGRHATAAASQDVLLFDEPAPVRAERGYLENPPFVEAPRPYSDGRFLRHPGGSILRPFELPLFERADAPALVEVIVEVDERIFTGRPSLFHVCLPKDKWYMSFVAPIATHY